MALAGRDGIACRREPGACGGITALGEAGAAGVAVVDEHRHATGVLVQRGRDAADIPSVARRDQGQEADRRVFGSVRGTGYVDVLQRGGRQHLGGDGPPHGLRAQVARREVERLLAEHGTGEVATLEIGHDLVGDLDVPVDEFGVSP